MEMSSQETLTIDLCRALLDDVAKNVKHAVGYVQEESSPSNISAMFVDIRADVIVHNACPFPVSLCTEPEDETNLIQLSKIEEVVDNKVGKFIVIKKTHRRVIRSESRK